MNKGLPPSFSPPLAPMKNNGDNHSRLLLLDIIPVVYDLYEPQPNKFQ